MSRPIRTIPAHLPAGLIAFRYRAEMRSRAAASPWRGRYIDFNAVGGAGLSLEPYESNLSRCRLSRIEALMIR